MTPPIRPAVDEASLYPWDEEIPTMRQLIDWHKDCVTALGQTPTELEVNHVNARWLAACERLADQQGIGVGGLAYLLQQWGLQEMAEQRR